MKLRMWIASGLGVAAFAVFLAWRAESPGPYLVSGDASSESAVGSEVGRIPVGEPVAGAETLQGASRPGDVGRAEPKEDGPSIIDSERGMRALMLSLADRLEAPMLEWGQTRGLPREDPNGNFLLDQPYKQYDNATLQAMADNGDMWAQQILADRISALRPAEAMELYRKAAASGSIYAMIQLAEVSARVARLSPDFEFEQEGVALEQYYSLRDSAVGPEITAYAWNAVAEMAGLPGFMSFIGDARMSDDEVGSACQLASSIYSDLLSQRDERGLGGYPADPPPIWFDASRVARGSGCEHDRAVRYDLSACEEYEIQNPESGEQVSLYVCGGA